VPVPAPARRDRRRGGLGRQERCHGDGEAAAAAAAAEEELQNGRDEVEGSDGGRRREGAAAAAGAAAPRAAAGRAGRGARAAPGGGGGGERGRGLPRHRVLLAVGPPGAVALREHQQELQAAGLLPREEPLRRLRRRLPVLTIKSTSRPFRRRPGHVDECVAGREQQCEASDTNHFPIVVIMEGFSQYTAHMMAS
jgi:hypothetical protein